MSRALLRPMLTLPLLFAALITLIRGYPYDTRELDEIRAFIGLSDDEPPVWMTGLEMGRMSMSEAREVLENHPWVDEITVSTSSRGSIAIRWTWSGQQHPLIDDSYEGYVTNALGLSDANMLAHVSVVTKIRLDDIYRMIVNTPNLTGDLRLVDATAQRFVYDVYYVDDPYIVGVIVAMECPISQLSLWHERVGLHIGYALWGDRFVPLEDTLSVCP